MVSIDSYEQNWIRKSQQLNKSRAIKRNTSIPQPTGPTQAGVYNSKQTLDRFIEKSQTPSQLETPRSKTILKKKLPGAYRAGAQPNRPIVADNSPRYPQSNSNSNSKDNSYNDSIRNSNSNSKPTPRQVSRGGANKASKYNWQGTQRSSLTHADIGTVRSNETPLPRASEQRNLSNRNSGDPYGIRPLPNIANSPWAGEEPPDLQHWGVPQHTRYDDNTYIKFDRGDSPFLPTYNLAKKAQKGYVIAPKFRRPVYPSPRQDGPAAAAHSKFEHIAAIPYFAQVNMEEYEERTNQNIQNVRNVIKTMDARSYSGEGLFSTKFIEDLDYTPNQYQANAKPLKPRLLPSDLYEIENSVRREQQPKPQPEARQQAAGSERNPEADEYIRQIRKEATELQPVRNYDLQPLVNAYSVDLAEKLLHEQVERMTREVAADVVGRELSRAAAYEKPLYDKVVDFAQNEMLRRVAEEVLAEERDKARGKDQAAIKQVAQDELVTNLMLDHMLDKMAQHGRASAENEDIGKILDGMIVDVLVNTHRNVNKMKDKTLKNYPIKKFHLNSFMNVALDILVAELSTNLEEDMKDLELLEQEQSN